jgi:hypothetical protein
MMRRNSSGERVQGVVPKEMVVPVCQRLAFVLFAMCVSTLGLRLYARYKMREALGMKPLTDSLTNIPVHGPHGFFLDIGDTKEGVSQTRLLEESGWKGVCVSAFPDAARSCEPISMPAAPVDGDQVMVPDCSEHSWPARVVLNALNRCPHTVHKGVGIDALLRLSKAPRVIDFVHLETEGSEASILEKFPFREFCVGAWTVTKAPSAELYTQQSRIAELLTDNNCKVEESRASYSARCACEGFTVKPKMALQMKSDARVAHADLLSKLREEAKARKAGRKAKKNQASLMESAPLETDSAAAAAEARQMRQKALKRQEITMQAEYAADGHIEYAHHVNSDGADDTREQ